MASRNLSKRFIELRNSAKANITLLGSRDDKDTSSDSELLTSTDSNSGKLRNTLPPFWVDKIQKVENDISKIQLKMRDLASLHTSRLMVNFESDEQKQEQEINLITQDITALFRNAEGMLKHFTTGPDDSLVSVSERTIRTNIQRNMAKKLQGLSFSFRASQKEYLKRLQSQKSGSGSQAFEFLESKQKSDFDYGFSSAQLLVAEELEEIANQRDAEITRIAKSIEELAQIFKELAVLVIDQGTILDRIDFNMENAVEHAKTGITQLEKAEASQKSAMSFRCIVVLVFLIAVMVIILILKHTRFHVHS